MSKYVEGKSMTDSGKWIIEHATNLDATSLTPFQETTIEGMAVIIIMLFAVLIFK